MLDASAAVPQGSDPVTHWISDRAGPKTVLDDGDKVLFPPTGNFTQLVNILVTTWN